MLEEERERERDPYCGFFRAYMIRKFCLLWGFLYVNEMRDIGWTVMTFCTVVVHKRRPNDFGGPRKSAFNCPMNHLISQNSLNML